MFEQMSIKIALGVWRVLYCEGQFETCERWKLASCGKPVPPALLPNGRTLGVPLEQLDPSHLR